MISYFTTFLSVLYYLYILFFKLRFQFFAFLFFFSQLELCCWSSVEWRRRRNRLSPLVSHYYLQYFHSNKTVTALLSRVV